MTRTATITRRAVLGAALLPAAGVAQTSTPAYDEAKAKQQGELTWYVSQMDGPTAEAVGNAFRERSGIKVNVVRITTQAGYQRLRQELRAKAMICDVLSTTDVGQYITLKRTGELARYKPASAAGLAPAFQDFDPDGMYYPTYAGQVVLARNTNLVTEAEAPKRWTDLLDPKWKGKITLGHPAFSGYSGNWAMLMRKAHGVDFLKKLAQQDPLVSRSIIDTVTVLNSGERMVGTSPSASVIASRMRGNPVEITYPLDGAVLMIAPSGIVAKGPHPDAARAFFEFLFTPEYMRIIVQSGSVSLRPDVPGLPGVPPLDQIKTIRATEQEAVVELPKVIEEWRDIFGT